MLWEHTTCIKIRDSFQRILSFFFHLCSLVNLGWGRVKDKPGIGSNTDSKQSGGYIYLSSCFLGAACALLLWVSRVDVRACVRVCVSLWVNATRPYLVENAWNFPNWLYSSFLQCSGLTQYILVITVGVPQMHVFQVSKYRIYILVSFPI